MGATAVEFVASLVFGATLGFIGGLLGMLTTTRPTNGQASAL